MYSLRRFLPRSFVLSAVLAVSLLFTGCDQSALAPSSTDSPSGDQAVTSSHVEPSVYISGPNIVSSSETGTWDVTTYYDGDEITDEFTYAWYVDEGNDGLYGKLGSGTTLSYSPPSGVSEFTLKVVADPKSSTSDIFGTGSDTYAVTVCDSGGGFACGY